MLVSGAARAQTGGYAAPGFPMLQQRHAKAALVQLTRCIALDHARHGIRANCLCPGYLEAVMADRRAEMTPAALAARAVHAAAAVPMGRAGSYAEMARLVLTLADPAQSAYVTGQALVADGGVTLV